MTKTIRAEDNIVEFILKAIRDEPENCQEISADDADTLNFDEQGWSETIPVTPEILAMLMDDDIIRFSRDDTFGRLWGDVKEESISHALAFQLYDSERLTKAEVPEEPVEIPQGDYSEIAKSMGLDDNKYFLITDEDGDSTSKILYLGVHDNIESAMDLADQALPDEVGYISTYPDAKRVLTCIEAFINAVVTKH